MKRLLCGLVFTAALFVGSQGVIAEEVSRQSLAELGLGGLQVMSDEEASTVRGQAFPVTVLPTFPAISLPTFPVVTLPGFPGIPLPGFPVTVLPGF